MPIAAYLVGLLLLREHVWARYGLILIGCWYASFKDKHRDKYEDKHKHKYIDKHKDTHKSLSWLPSIFSPSRSTDHDAVQSRWHREQLLDGTFWRRHQPLHHYDLLQVIITNILHKIILVTTSTLENLSSSSPSPSHYPHHSQLHPCQHVSELWNDHLLALVLCQVRPSRGRPFQAALPSSDQNL